MKSPTMTVQITRRDGPHGHIYTVIGDPRVEGVELPGVTTYLGIIDKGQGLRQWYANKAVQRALEQLLETTWQEQDAVLEKVPDDLFGGTRYRLRRPWVEAVVEAARHRPDELRNQAVDFGTQTHALIAQFIEGKNPPIPSQQFQAMHNFQEWRRESGIVLFRSEQMVYSARHGFATTLDIEGRFLRSDTLAEIPVVEVKTSNRLYREHDLQVVAEGKALEEMRGIPVSQYWLLRLGKDKPEFEARLVTDPERCFEAFLHAKGLYEELRR